MNKETTPIMVTETMPKVVAILKVGESLELEDPDESDEPVFFEF